MNTLPSTLPPEVPGPPEAGAAPPPPAGPAPRRLDPIDLAAIGAVVAVFAWSYLPNLTYLYGVWVREPDYSHGFLVLPIATWILWKLWPAPGPASPRPWPAGWLLVLAALGGRWHYHEQGANWSESATLLPLIAGLGLARGGWRFFARVWPAFAYLIFLLPLPDAVNTSLSQPLQSLATQCSCWLLRLTGLWVMPEGNVILVGKERLEVAAACNGLSMLMSLAATVAAVAALLPMALIKRAFLLAFIVPIALFSNVIRITATAWCYYKFGAEVGSKYAHDAAGWAMMPLAMLLVWLELSILGWIIIESTEPRRPEGTGLGLDRVQNSWNPGAGT